MKSKMLRKMSEVKEDIIELINAIKDIQIPKHRKFLIRELEKVDDEIFEVVIKLKNIKVAMYNLKNAI